MFESTEDGMPGGGSSRPAAAGLLDVVELDERDLVVALEVVPSEPTARLAWLTRELRRVGVQVAAGEFARPVVEPPGEPAPEGDGAVPAVSQVAPVDAVRVEVITLLESLKSVAAGAQARVTAAFARSQEAAALADLAARGGGGPSTTAGDGAGAQDADLGDERVAGRGPDGPAARAQARRRARAERLARSSVVGQVGLARRISPARAVACVAAATAWTSDLPCTLAALDAGEVSEWGAEIVARETSTLAPELRRTVDQQVGAGLRCWSERAIRAAVIARGYALDPQAAVARHEKAVGQRRVSTRAAEDGMVWLTALLPVVQGIACQSSLSAAASAAKTAGDGRGHGQLMADLLVQAVTGQPAGTPDLPEWVTDPTRWGAAAPERPGSTDSSAGGTGSSAGGTGSSAGGTDSSAGGTRSSAGGTDSSAGGTDSSEKDPVGGDGCGSTPSPSGRRAAGPPAVPVEVQVVISAEALWGDPDDLGYDQPAHVPGYGPIPAWLARHLVRDAPGTSLGPPSDDGSRSLDEASRAATFLRRLWACPDTGALVALESRRRVFDGGLRRFLIARDQVCRTPFCDAPVRQLDHVRPHADGGPTSAANGQGLCARCNQTKEAPGWSAATAASTTPSRAAAPRTVPRRPHEVVLTTPTGRTAVSIAPPLLSRPATSPPDRSATPLARSTDLVVAARRCRSRREVRRMMRDTRRGRPLRADGRPYRPSAAEARLLDLLVAATCT